MKKILFCLQTMVVGGVEKELITIMKKFDTTKYEISLLLLYKQDEEILKTIPNNIKVYCLDIDKNYYCSGLSTLVKSRLKKEKVFEPISLLLKKVFRIGATSANVNIEDMPNFDMAFDYAVCYHMHSPIMLRYVAKKVNAKTKIAWIHNDFTNTGYNIKAYEKCLETYDKIIAVSTKLKDEFISILPKLKEKTKVVFNIVDSEEIISKANIISGVEGSFLSDNKIKFLTVGRFATQKGFDIAIEVCKILVDKGIDISWYAIGYGDLENTLKELVKKHNLQNNFIILGKKENPYPYMKNCDVYVQPSRHEGYAITICEAKALKKFIIATNFAGIQDQIQDGYNGIILQSFDAMEIANQIQQLLANNQKIEEIKKNIAFESLEDGWLNIENVFIEK